jgi:Cu2+-exporting ATPase
LDHYYDLRDNRINPVQAAALQERDYGWLEKRAAGCEAAAKGTAEMVLDLEGISCVGCVWLIEKVFRDHPGSVRIEINTQYGQVRLLWRPGIFNVVDFAREIQQFGYVFGPPGERPQEESRRLVGKIGLSGAFALNAMLFTLPRYLGMDPSFSLAPVFELLSLLFATLSLLAGGSYFIKRGITGILRGVLHIDFPIAVGIIVAWAGSLAGWLIGDVRFLYFDFVAIFIFLMLVGRWVQERALEKNRHQLLSRNKAPKEVHLVSDDLLEESNEPLESLLPGQRFRILPGEVVPVLAELETQKAALSMEWINGESAMRTLANGQYVPSGSQNIGIEPILLSARQTWKDSLLSRLLETHPEEQRNPFLEKILKVYLLTVLALAGLGAITWAVVLQQPLSALQVVLSVLIVSCPCALGVAYPLAQEWAILQLRRKGVFVRSPLLFNQLGKIRRAIFDKTGTLTLEAPALANEEALATLDNENRAVLREMVRASLHPVSRALREALLRDTCQETHLPNDLRITEEVGMGLRAESASRKGVWTLGRPDWLSDGGSAQATDIQCAFRLNGTLLTGFRFDEAMREDAVDAIQSIHKRYPVTILSGDRITKVRSMAEHLGLPAQSAIGEQSPEEKAAFVQGLGDARALYIGDGANDSLAFSAAEVRGTPATPHGLLQDKADFYFTGRSLSGLLELFSVHKLRQKAVRSAFAFAVLYNLIVVAIALAGKMHPLLAAILMPLSSLVTISIVAVIYKQREKRVQA